MARAVAFAGSLSVNSWNKKILEVVVQSARTDGIEVEVLDLAEFNLPFVNTGIFCSNSFGLYWT